METSGFEQGYNLSYQISNAHYFGETKVKNLKNGRGNFFLENIPNASPQDYVFHVVETYERLSPYVQGVQIERSPDIWIELYETLQKFAYNFLVKKGLYSGKSTFHLGIDCATDAAIAILDARFPYDTDFDPWIYNFVKFACLKRIQQGVKRSNNMKEVIYQDVVLDEFSAPVLNNQRRDIIIDAINAYLQLSENRQEVLRLRYEKGLSSKEIAIQMGKSVNAIDKLHFDAIRQLRQLLDVNVI